MKVRKKKSSRLLAWFVVIAVAFTMTVPTAFVWGATANGDDVATAETKASASDAEKDIGGKPESTAAEKQTAKPAAVENSAKKKDIDQEKKTLSSETTVATIETEANKTSYTTTADFLKAFNAVTGLAQVKLESNIDLGEIATSNDHSGSNDIFMVKKGAEIELDLNGKTITAVIVSNGQNYGTDYVVGNSGILTIKDGSTNKTGKISNTAENCFGCTATIRNQAEAEMYIAGGKITSTQGNAIRNNGQMEIYAGDIYTTGNYDSWDNGSVAIHNRGQLEIKESKTYPGEIKVHTTYQAPIWVGSFNGTPGKTRVSYGEFYSEHAPIDIQLNDGSAIVTGGTWHVDPSDYVAKGYYVKQSEETFSVEKTEDKSFSAATMSELKAALSAAGVSSTIDVTITENFQLTEDLTIPKGVYVTIPNGKVLSAGRDKILTISGELKNEGTFDICEIGNGYVNNIKNIVNNGTIKRAVKPEKNVYKVSSPAELQFLYYDICEADKFTGKIELTGDLDFLGYSFVPLNDENHAFSGIMDGKGHKLSNVKIIENLNGAGLFDTAEGAAFKNLTIKDCYVKTVNGHVGVLAANVYGATVEYVAVSGESIGENTYFCGGLFGYLGSGQYDFYKCTTGLSVTGYYNVGAYWGTSESATADITMVDCQNTGDLKATGGTIHVIAGFPHNVTGNVYGFENTGTITEKDTITQNPELKCGKLTIQEDAKDKMKVKIGHTYYETIADAISAAKDGDTINIQAGTYTEAVRAFPEPNHSTEKSITLAGANSSNDPNGTDWSENETILTGGMYLGYDDSNTRDHQITVKGITFKNKGLSIADEKSVLIENNKFLDIGPGVDGNANAIAVLDQEYAGMQGSVEIKNNDIETVKTEDSAKSAMGINLRNPYQVTIIDNNIKATDHNAILLQKNAALAKNSGRVVICGNRITNWDANNDEGGGRALRLDFTGNQQGSDDGKNIAITKNIFNKADLTEASADKDFVKITGVNKSKVDLTNNYWNSAKPDFKTIFLVTNDEKKALNKEVSPFYTDPSLAEESLRSDIESVDLNKIKATLHRGEDLQLSAIITPSGTYDAYDESLTWASDNKNVATVDDRGKVTAVAPGTASITVTAANGEKDVCSIRVIEQTVVARIGSEPYDSLSSAVAAAKDGDTITITEDVTLTETEPIKINKKITLTDDGDRTITVDYAPENGTAPFQISVSGVTIKDLNVVLTQDTFNIVYSDGKTVSLENNIFKAEGDQVALRKPFNSIGGGSKLVGNTVISGNKSWKNEENGILSVRTGDSDVKVGEILIKDNHFERFYKGISVDHNEAEVPVTVVNNKFVDVDYAFEMKKGQKNDSYAFSRNYSGGTIPKVLEEKKTTELADAPTVLPYYQDEDLAHLATALKAIELNAKTMNVKQGDRVQLIASVIPETDTGDYNKEVTWSVSNEESGVEVSKEGVVTVADNAATGNVTVTAAVEGDSTKPAQCTITIAAKAAGEATVTQIQPTVEDKNIKSDDVKTAIGNTEKGQDVVIVAPTAVPAPIIEPEIIQAAKANESNLIVETQQGGDNLKATFSFDAEQLKDTSIAVKTGITAKQMEKTPSELGDAAVTGISLAHEGSFPGPASITVALPTGSIDAQHVYLYCLQGDTLKLVNNGALPVQTGTDNTKQVSFTLLHASDYVFSSKPMKASAAKSLVDQAIEAISSLDAISYTSEWDGKIKDARAAYEGFKAQYPDKTSMYGSDEAITAAENKYEALDAQVKAFRKALKEFDDVKGILSYKQQKSADQLAVDYEALNAEQKAAVEDVAEQYNKVVEQNAASKDAELQTQVNWVSELVAQLPQKVSYSAADKSKIDTARNTYNSIVRKTPEAAALLTEELKEIKAAEADYRKAEDAYKAERRTAYSNARISLSATQYAYDGKAKIPKVNGLSGFTSGTDYTVTYKNNVKTGKATVTVTAKGIMSGLKAKTATFRIIPAKAAISKLKKGKKSFKVTIKSQKSTGVSGYQISYSKKKNKGYKSVRTTKTSKTIKKLKANKKYYVKVRAYKTIDGKRYYGTYSSVKKVKTK